MQKLEWSDWSGQGHPVTMTTSGAYIALIQAVDPSPETTYRKRRYAIQHSGATLATGFCNSTSDAEAMIAFLLELS